MFGSLHPKKRDDIQYTQKYPEIPGNTQEYPEIPESEKDTRKYPIVYFNTPTRPEPGIFSNAPPNPLLKNPPRWALIEARGSGLEWQEKFNL